MAYGRETSGAGPFTIIFASVVVSAGVAMAGSFIANSIVEAPVHARTVTVTGQAQRDVIADLALWRITLSRSGEDANAVNQALTADVETVREYLIGQGFDAAEVSPEPIAIVRAGSLATLTQALVVRSTDVDQVAAASQTVGDLVATGVGVIDVSAPTYAFTRMDDLRSDLIEEAARDARIAAQDIADETGVVLEGLRGASHDHIEVTARDGEAKTDPARQPFKRVQARTRAEFFVAAN